MGLGVNAHLASWGPGFFAFLSFIDFNMDIDNKWVKGQVEYDEPIVQHCPKQYYLDEIYLTIISRAYKNSGHDEYAFSIVKCTCSYLYRCIFSL